MSNYIKLDIEKLYEKHDEDIKKYNCTFNSNTVCDEDCPFHGWTCEMMDWLESLPTIEVSEDCISREYLEEQLQQIEDITAMAHIDLGEDPYDETEEITMPISTVRKIFKNAPSVLPKVNKDEWVEEFSDDGWRWVKDEL